MENEFINDIVNLLEKYPDIKLGEFIVRAVAPSHRKTLEPYFQNYLFEVDNTIVIEGLKDLVNENSTAKVI
jgi:hypothetical protein